MLRFLEHTVPLADGARCIKPKLDVRDANLTRGDSALYRSSTMRQGGAHHTRNSSDSAIGLAAGPSGKALLGPHESAEGLWSPKGEQIASIVGWGIAQAGSVAPAGWQFDTNV